VEIKRSDNKIKRHFSEAERREEGRRGGVGREGEGDIFQLFYNRLQNVVLRPFVPNSAIRVF
jgi:hypothetical protein